MSEPCEHLGFEANVEVARLTAVDGGPVTGYSATLFVWCAMCDERFEFIGAPAGLSPRQPTTNVSGTELRIPLRPPGSPEGWGEDGPSFSIRMMPGARREPAEPGVDLSDPDDHGLLG